MTKAIPVVGLSLRLLFRNGTLGGLTLLSIGTTAFLFWISGSGGTLETELTLRIRYALCGSFAVLGPTLIYLSALSFSSDLSGRQFHAMVSAPVSRTALWSGRLAAFSLAGTLALWSGWIVLFILALSYAHTFSEIEQQDAWKHLKTAQVVISSIVPDYNRQAKMEFKRLKTERFFSDAVDESSAIIGLADRLRMRDEVPENQIGRLLKIEKFPENKPFKLNLTFEAPNRLRETVGEVTLGEANGTIYLRKQLSGTAGVPMQMLIPPGKIPSSVQVLEVNYRLISSVQSIRFPMDKGFQISWEGNSLGKNLGWLFGLGAGWVLSVTALGLMFSAAFSFSVSVFVAELLFLTGFGSLFFVSSAEVWVFFSEPTFYDGALTGLVRTVGTLTASFSPPPVIEALTEAESIQFERVSGWLGSAGITLFLLCAIASQAIRHREISRGGEG